MEFANRVQVTGEVVCVSLLANTLIKGIITSNLPTIGRYEVSLTSLDLVIQPLWEKKSQQQVA